MADGADSNTVFDHRKAQVGTDPILHWTTS